LPTDTYSAFLGIYAGYASAEYQPLEKLRLLGGVRYEASQQNLSAQSPFSVTRTRPEGNQQTYQDILPTANVVYDLTDKLKVRGGYSFTLARPTFRELAPFLFYDFVRRRAVSGNPNLVETRVHNGDARLEYYAGENDVFAASVFAKQFLSPIERVIVSVGSGDLSFRNADAATVLGAEFEARFGWGRVHPALRSFRSAANLTLIQSTVSLGANTGSQTNASRPLQGQSPYVANFSLGYQREKSGTEVAVLYNVYGPRISEVGFETLPDVYEQAFHRVDVTVSQKLSGGFQLKVTGANLLDSSLVFKQGPFEVLKFRPGLSMSASLAWSI
jgi:TonB-dependent receptor